MKHLNNYITEYIVKKKLDTPIDSEDHYEYFPETKEELSKNIEECLNSKNYNLNCIDTSKITDMSDLFYNSKFENINIDVSKWDVSKVTKMEYMFCNCVKFDCDLSDWNVSNVINMDRIFVYCNKFTGKGLENWDVSKVTNMNYMFYNCENFDCDLSKWNVSNVISMSSLFNGCKNFAGKGLENWNVSNVKNMHYMFNGCKSLINTPTWYKK